MLNPRLEALSDYMFRRLARLLEAVAPAAGLAPIDLSIGQPMHPVPALLTETLRANDHLWGRYPPVNGTPEFRAATAAWLTRRYHLPAGTLDPERHVLPVRRHQGGAVHDRPGGRARAQGGRTPGGAAANPFYNVYLGAAAMAGAEPVLLSVSAATGHLPALEDLAPSCSSGPPPSTCARRPTRRARPPISAICSADRARAALRFVAAGRRMLCRDLREQAPVGALEAAPGWMAGSITCWSFHSLSKRSSAAGLRSGFVAGDPVLLAAFARLRSYGAAVQPLPVLAAATALWQDEEHVIANRALYQAKFDLADRCSAAVSTMCGRMAASSCGSTSATVRR